MILFYYLDKLPAVPMHIVNSLLNLNLAPHNAVSEYDPKAAKRFKLPDDVETWLDNNIVNIPGYASRYASVRTFIPNSKQSVLAPHTDTRRKWAISFALDTGGDNTYTNFYLESGQLLARDINIIWDNSRDELLKVHSVKIEKFRWHILNTHVLHDITGLTHPRKMLTIGTMIDNPFTIIKEY